MKFLLDTHVAVWTILDETMLRSGELQQISRPDAELALSAVSLWELRLKWNSFHPSGERKGPIDPEQTRSFAEAFGWTLLPLMPLDAIATLDTPISHKDPFDEMLLIQAQRHGMRLLTRDARLAAHPLAITG